MNLKNILIYALFYVISYNAICQESDSTKSYIYKTYDEYLNNNASEILDHENGDIFKFVFPAGLQTRLKSKTGDLETIYKPGDIWGFKHKGELFRYYQTKKQEGLGGEYYLYYKVIYNNEIVIYTMHHEELVGYSFDNYDAFYYSDNLTSAIKVVSDKNLFDDFPHDSEKIKKIKEHCK